MTAVLPAHRPGAAPALPPEERTATLADPRAGWARRVLSGLGRWSVRGLLLVATLAFVVLAVGPHVLGYRTMTMLTGRLAPQIAPGDVVLSPPIDDHRVVTHRVVSVQNGRDGDVTVQTKGDANTAVDPWQATLQGDTAYQLRAVLPKVGHVIGWLREPVVARSLVYGAPALLAGWLILGIWRPARDEEEQR